MSRTAQKVFLPVLLLILVLSFSFCFAESYDASTMRLLRHEGSVEIFDVSGQSRFLMDNVRFVSGEAMRTGEDGKASVGLDDTKIVTMDSSSHVEFMQEADHIRLKLTEGTIFLDVQQKLDENEGLDIQTSTMTVGIRGTVVFVNEAVSADDPSLVTTTLGVLEGTAESTYADATGAVRRISVPAGQIVRITGRRNTDAAETSASVSTQVSDLTAADIAGFISEQVLSDAALTDRIISGNPAASRILNGEDAGANTEKNLYPANGDWTWTDEITLVAQSASKLYDGSPLTRPSNVLVYGLPSDFTISVSASGSQTDAGSSANDVSSYTIYNAGNEDVTSHFSHVETVSGNLLVSPVPAVVWTGSAEKYYDGEPLTCPEAGICTVYGYTEEQRNVSMVTQTALGSEKLVSVSGRTYVYGTNPLTGDQEQMELQAGQSLSVWLHNGKENRILEFRIEDLAEEEVPEVILRLFADNPDLLAQTCLDTGWDPDLMASLIAALPASEEATVTQAGLNISESLQPYLITDASDVRIHIDSDITNYGSRPLGVKEVEFITISPDPSITVTATGSRTEPGESENTYTITWGDVNQNNYVLRDDLGTLKVLERLEDGVVITASSSSKVYDGKELTNDIYYVRGLPEGYKVRAAVEGSITEVGSAVNKITWAIVTDADGNDVSDKFTIRLVNGTLTVEPLRVSISLGGNTTVTYSGSPYIPSPVATYLNGPRAGQTVQGSTPRADSVRAVRYLAYAGARLRAAQSYAYRFVFYTGDKANVSLTGFDAAAGSHEITGSVSCSSSSVQCSFASNVTITVEPAALSISTGSAEKIYDGEPLTCDTVTVSGLVGGDSVTVTANGAQTEAGISDNTYTVDWGDVNPKNYKITATLGTLTVTRPAAVYGPVTFTAPSDSKVYDGTPLTPGAATAQGLPEGFTFTAVVSGSQTNAGESESAVTSLVIRDAAGTDVTSSFPNVTRVSGTLTVTPATLTIASGSAEKAYDGTPLTAAVTITGLAANDAVTATASGTQTNVGTSDNTFTVDWGTVNKANYTVTETTGTLTVTPAKLSIVSASAEKTYDGKPLTAGDVTITGLAASDRITVTASGSQTNAGTSDNTFTVDWGTVNKANYTVTETAGTLTVKPATLTITTGDAETVYDGMPLFNDDVTVSGLVGDDDIEVTAVGEQINVGVSKNTYTIDWGEVNSNNYSITENLGTLTVTPATATITIDSDAKTYDGMPYVNIMEVSLGEVDTIIITVTSTQINVGVGTFSYTINWGTVNPSNYTITVEVGELTVEKRSVTLTSTLINHTVTVSGDGFADGEGATYNVTGSQTGQGSSANTFGYTLNAGTSADNYTITLVYGTLTIE